jgi:hypothetical protein
MQSFQHSTNYQLLDSNIHLSKKFLNTVNIQNNSKLLSGFVLIFHTNSDNKLESLPIFCLTRNYVSDPYKPRHDYGFVYFNLYVSGKT